MCIGFYCYSCYILDFIDVVCVIGIINVKCMGFVWVGEWIYVIVDLDNFGIVILEFYLLFSVVFGKISILLGMLMEEKKVFKLDDVNLV